MAMTQPHTTYTKITTLGDRQHFRVGCSCGDSIGLTDSREAAQRMAQTHAATPECTLCAHRNVHSTHNGCLYVNMPDAASKPLTCTCKGVATGGLVPEPTYRVGE